MGALSGILNLQRRTPVDRTVLERMGQIQQHRGSAAELFLDPFIGLEVRSRLAPDAAFRPPSSPEEQQRFLIGFSGQLYNRHDLRQEILSRGGTPRAGTDAEIVFQAYEIAGPSCVKRLNGQFALAIWDRLQSKLFLARDPLGISPLHYALCDGQFVFATEAKGVLQHPCVRKSVDEWAVAESLQCGALFDGRTFLVGVSALEPGTSLTIDASGLRLRRYWAIPWQESLPEPADEVEVAEQLRGLLSDAIRIRIPEDESWGIQLSGGLDSSTMTALASEVTSQPLRTFTIDFPNPWRGTDLDAHYAELVSQQFGTDHHLLLANGDAYFGVLDRLAHVLEKPYNKAVATAFLLGQHVAPHAGCVFCGEGMDELLAGYIGARGLGVDDVLANGRIEAFPWMPHHTIVDGLWTEEFLRAVRPAEVFSQRLSKELADLRQLNPLNQALCLYARHFLRELVELHEQALWAIGVETRFPFLDHRVVEFLTKLPLHLKVRDGQGKYALRLAMGERIPTAVLQRRKSHLPIPRDPRSSSQHLQLARELLLSPQAMTSRFFDRQALVDFLHQQHAFENLDSLTVWQISMNMMTLELMLRNYNL